MAIILDTDQVHARERADLLHAALLETSGASRVELELAPGPPSGLLSLSPLGSTALFSARTSGMRLTRTAKDATNAPEELVAVAVQQRGTGRHETTDGQRLVRPGDLMVVDVTRPFDFSWPGAGASTALQVPRGELGLSVDEVRRASHRLQSSRLYGLFSRYLLDVIDQSRALTGGPADPVADELGRAGSHLLRALLLDAARNGRPRPDTFEETLLPQLLTFVRQHLGDPDLGADRIAAELAISRRTLYRITARAGISLEQHIIEERLTAAKSMLAQAPGRPVATIARACGFKDPDHFARRFRGRFGLTPAEWRLAVLTDGTNGQAPPREG